MGRDERTVLSERGKREGGPYLLPSFRSSAPPPQGSLRPTPNPQAATTSPSNLAYFYPSFPNLSIPSLGLQVWPPAWSPHPHPGLLQFILSTLNTSECFIRQSQSSPTTVLLRWLPLILKTPKHSLRSYKACRVLWAEVPADLFPSSSLGTAPLCLFHGHLASAGSCFVKISPTEITVK